MVICRVLDTALFNAAARAGLEPIVIGKGSDSRIIGYVLTRLAE